RIHAPVAVPLGVGAGVGAIDQDIRLAVAVEVGGHHLDVGPRAGGIGHVLRGLVDEAAIYTAVAEPLGVGAGVGAIDQHIGSAVVVEVAGYHRDVGPVAGGVAHVLHR